MAELFPDPEKDQKTNQDSKKSEIPNEPEKPNQPEEQKQISEGQKEPEKIKHPEKTKKPEEPKEPKMPLAPLQEFNETLKRYEGIFVSLLEKKGISPQEFMKTIVNACRKNPKLLNCNRVSLMASVLTCAELGLKPNTPEQHCYIIPYNGMAEFQMGYKGYVHLAYQHPRIKRISTEIVFENDAFEFELGLTPKLKHLPARDNRGSRQGVYALVEIEGAGFQIAYMTAEEVRKMLTRYSKTQDNWSEKNDIMGWFWKKTAIKQVAKLIPKGQAEIITKASMYDSLVEMGGTMNVEEGKVTIIYDKPAQKEYSFVEDILDVEILEETIEKKEKKESKKKDK
ncbi:MAG: recombinase RecT [Parachlamydiales bacterium]